MITILVETDDEQHAVGRAQHDAQPAGLFGGQPFQVVHTPPGTWAAHQADTQPGGPRVVTGSPGAALKARLAADPLAPPGIVLAAVRDAATAQIAAGGPMWRLRCSVDIEQAHRFPGMLGVEVYRTWRPGRWQLLDAGGGVIATSGDTP